MKFMLLIYHSEQRWNEITESERQQVYAEYRQLREELQSNGKFLDGSQLKAADTATSIQIRNSDELVTDGPFAETHEQLAGYFLVDVPSVDEAIAIAKRIPSVRTGTVEIRALA